MEVPGLSSQWATRSATSSVPYMNRSIPQAPLGPKFASRRSGTSTSKVQSRPATGIHKIKTLLAFISRFAIPQFPLRNWLPGTLVAALVWGIGLSLGGTTGYAINPARDFGPRLAHALLPLAG